MEYIWMTVFVVGAAVITFGITYFSLHGKITNAGKIVAAVQDVLYEITAAIKPDPDGKVTVTPEELAAIKAKIDLLIKLIKDLF